MAIVTISRGTFGGGQKLAHLVAGKLNYRVVSRELVFERVRDTFAVEMADLQTLIDRAPPVFDEAAKALGRKLLAAIQASMCELLEEDGVVYHGQVGHLFLSGVEHVLRVRTIAPRPVRVRMAMGRERLSEYEANRKIDHVDADRARWIRFFYGADWEDPLLYDMVLNLEAQTMEDIAEVVAFAAGLPSSTATEASRAKMRNLTLAARVKAHLLFNAATSSLPVSVEADAGKVRISGLLTDRWGDVVSDLVRSVPGVEAVEATLR